MKKPELLAPAGALGNLKAAIASGADAVYVGMPRFSARDYAKNFDEDYLKKAVQICKSNNIKIFLTMNTLVKNSEINDFFKQLSFAYLAGIDSVIIQEPCFIEIIKKFYPELKVHMSTQAGVMNSFHANLFSGADRIILAREMSKENILSIRKNFKKELEIFIHGALCACISGSCLFSSFIGGRSGNRGKCAQPCRKLYSGNYYLSTKELCLIEKINEIKKPGLDSLKIEGRMRTPYYVATVTSIYRNALDNENFKLTPEILKRLKSAYSREFTMASYSSENVFNRGESQGSSFNVEKEYIVPVKNISANSKCRECKLQLPETKRKNADKKQVLIRIYNKKDAIDSDKNGADIIYLDMFHNDFIDIKNSIKTKVYAVTPRIMFDSNVHEILEKIKEIKPDGLLVGNLGVLNLGLKLPMHLDYNCNCFNDYSLSYFESLGAFPIISPELSMKEQSEFKNKNFASLVHGKIRLMTLAHKLEKKQITDKKNFTFKIKQIYNGSEILNEKEIGLFNKAKNLLKGGITSFFIDTEENAGEMVKIYRQILNGKTVDVSKIRQKYVLGWSQEGVL